MTHVHVKCTYMNFINAVHSFLLHFRGGNFHFHPFVDSAHFRDYQSQASFAI